MRSCYSCFFFYMDSHSSVRPGSLSQCCQLREVPISWSYFFRSSLSVSDRPSTTASQTKLWSTSSASYPMSPWTNSSSNWSSTTFKQETAWNSVATHHSYIRTIHSRQVCFSWLLMQSFISYLVSTLIRFFLRTMVCLSRGTSAASVKKIGELSLTTCSL